METTEFIITSVMTLAFWLVVHLYLRSEERNKKENDELKNL